MWYLFQIRNDRVTVLQIMGESDHYLPFSWREWRRPCRLLSEYRMGMLVGTPGLPGAVSQLRQFITSLSLWTPNYIPRAVHMRSVVFPSRNHYTNILYHILFICHIHYIVLITDIIINDRLQFTVKSWNLYTTHKLEIFNIQITNRYTPCSHSCCPCSSTNARNIDYCLKLFSSSIKVSPSWHIFMYFSAFVGKLSTSVSFVTNHSQSSYCPVLYNLLLTNHNYGIQREFLILSFQAIQCHQFQKPLVSVHVLEAVACFWLNILEQMCISEFYSMSVQMKYTMP
jgi:hypothetical protein